MISNGISRLAMCLEYDGSNYHGWQIQKGVVTVQETLEEAVSSVADEQIQVITAGRTDAGVHATGQIVHYDTRSNRSGQAWLRGTNSNLPESVVVSWVLPVPATFHARYSAITRSYRYVLLNRLVRPTYLSRRVSWDYRPLDINKMKVAAKPLLGAHDFNAYRAVSCQSNTSTRIIHELEINQKESWIWFDIKANGFLKHMVRNIVGVLVAIGAGESEPDWSSEVLETRDRTMGGVTATADGLYLCGVSYSAGYNLPPAPPPCRFW